MWLSGYLYHLHCSERWCINEEFDATSPILFPQVPHSQQHRSEQWKREYIAGLGCTSYQKSLLTRSQDAGLTFEMERYANWTIEAMTSWRADRDTIDVKLEDFMADFDGALTSILRHFGMSEADIPKALSAAASEDVQRMSDLQIAKSPYIHARSISKWRAMLTPDQRQRFEARYGSAIKQLGYTLLSAEPGTFRDSAHQLSASSHRTPRKTSQFSGTATLQASSLARDLRNS